MSSEATKNPSGGADSRHVMERHSLNPVTVAQVLDKENLHKAWKQVKANKGAPGIDGITIEEFPEYARTNWAKIKDSLLDRAKVKAKEYIDRLPAGSRISVLPLCSSAWARVSPPSP